jgi:hypothetical protein
MKHVLSFQGPRVGLTKPYQHQVIELETQGRVQLHYKAPGQKWELGHGKDIPLGMDAFDVAETMREFILGDITLSEYNAVLPV